MEPSPGYLKNPRILLSGFIALMLISSAIWASRTQEKNEGMMLATISDAEREGVEADDDGDSLMRWQEELWGTDPKKADSDGDGTPDGEEVRLGRIPTTPGPNDRKESGEIPVPRYYDDDPTLTTTDVIGRDLYSGYIAMKESGSLTDENVRKLADMVLVKTLERTPAVVLVYKDKDVKKGAREDIEAYRGYANGLGNIFAKYRDDTVESELDMLARVIEENEVSLLPRLAVIAKTYGEISKLIIALPVPLPLAPEHLILANGYAMLSQSVDRFQVFHTDPMANIESIQTHAIAITQIEESFLSLRDAIIGKGVVFTSADPATQLFGIHPQAPPP